MRSRIKGFILKEFRHIFRDPRSLAIVLVMPIMMVLIYGYALNMDVNNIRIGVCDQDKSAESRLLISKFTASDYFDIRLHSSDISNIRESLHTGLLRAALVIPQGYGKDRKARSDSRVQILVDGSDPTYGNATMNYATAMITEHMLTTSRAAGLIPVEVRDRFLYNPDLKGANFIIPGLVAVILMMICALLTSITVSREKETGTLDVVLVSPVHPSEIIIGKVLPYVLISLVDAVFILIFARIVFGIPVQGDLVGLLGLAVLFIYCALSIGLMISSIASTQQVAMMAALVATILPSILLSGFIFPIFSMPVPLQALTTVVPAKYFMIIIRGILLKSGTFSMYTQEGLTLFLLGTFFLGIATLRFKTRVH
ncbi:ABC transporter permease [Candidatus Latescibacterota bacterium]